MASIPATTRADCQRQFERTARRNADQRCRPWSPQCDVGPGHRDQIGECRRRVQVLWKDQPFNNRAPARNNKTAPMTIIVEDLWSTLGDSG
jgi:hypothetical protein